MVWVAIDYNNIDAPFLAMMVEHEQGNNKIESVIERVQRSHAKSTSTTAQQGETR